MHNRGERPSRVTDRAYASLGIGAPILRRSSSARFFPPRREDPPSFLSVPMLFFGVPSDPSGWVL